MRSLATRLREGTIGLDQWLADMRVAVKDVHLYSSALAKGGWAQMTKADFGRVGRTVKDQYAYLDRFAADIDAGMALDGRFLMRVELYVESGRRTYYDVVARELPDGFDEERSVLHPADHCDECVEQAALGWQERGAMIPVGERTCLSRCRCTQEWRNSATGAVWG
jgi:hypothetical protein